MSVRPDHTSAVYQALGPTEPPLPAHLRPDPAGGVGADCDGRLGTRAGGGRTGSSYGDGGDIKVIARSAFDCVRYCGQEILYATAKEFSDHWCSSVTTIQLLIVFVCTIIYTPQHIHTFKCVGVLSFN